MSETTTNSTLNDVTQVIVTGITTKARWYDVLERVLWTLLQVATGEVIVNLLNGSFVHYTVMYNGHVFQMGQEWVILFTLLIAAAKNVIATLMGNGTASTLPIEYEPVPPTTVTTTTTVDTASVTPEAPAVEVPATPDVPSPDVLS